MLASVTGTAAAAAAAGIEAAITGTGVAPMLSVACTTSGLSGSALRLRDAPPSAFWRNFFDAAIIALEDREGGLSITA